MRPFQEGQRVIDLRLEDIAWAVALAKRTCRRLAIPCNEEVLQDARCAVWEASRRFNPTRRTRFRDFAWRRVVYSMRQWRARHRREATSIDATRDDGSTLAATLPHSNGDPAKRAPVREAAARLYSLARPADRPVLDMLAAGLTQTQIARRVGVSHQAVSQQIARLRKAAASPHAHNERT